MNYTDEAERILQDFYNRRLVHTIEGYPNQKAVEFMARELEFLVRRAERESIFNDLKDMIEEVKQWTPSQSQP